MVTFGRNLQNFGEDKCYIKSSSHNKQHTTQILGSQTLKKNKKFNNKFHSIRIFFGRDIAMQTTVQT